MNEIGLFMDPGFLPKQKDNITLTTPKPILDITFIGNYCLVLCEAIIQVYSVCTFTAR